jgi:Flp pilus assembly protein TadD/uncharacterized protein (AIM24 family)
MAGAPRDPTASERDSDSETRVDSRRLTPSIGIELDAPSVPSNTTNEDFLFHLYRGSELLQDDRVHEAKEELERALAMQPRDAKGQDLLAIVYFRLGHYPRAIAIYEQLRRSSPRDPALLLNLALCYLKTGQPSFARHELAELVKIQPTHLRAWGYLGLACERLGDLEAAREAFERGGHTPRVRRMDARLAEREGDPLAPPSDTSPRSESWQSLDIGHALRDLGGLAATLPHTVVPISDTGAPHSMPHLAAPAMSSRRPTLIAPAAPAAETALLEATLELHASPSPPSGVGMEASLPTLGQADDGTGYGPARRMPPSPGARPGASPGLVAPAPGTTFLVPPLGPPGAVGPGRTLPPALHRNTAPLPAASQLTRESVASFPPSGEVVVHAMCVALVRTGAAGFHVRPEALRVVATSMASETVLRRMQGRPTAEPLGGLASPISLFKGDGKLVVGARPGRKLSAFLLEGEVAFVREDLLLGFDGNLAHESGRVTDGTDGPLAIVQLEGAGAVLLEALGELIGLDVTPASDLVLRREAVVAWFGRLVPRAVPTAQAPGGQHGILSFGGDGRVLFATA